MNKSRLIPILLIIILGFAVYGNSIGGKFLWDDEYLIKFNVYTKNFIYLPNIFTQDIGAGSGRVFGFYRPVQIATYCVDHALWGLNEAGYHLTNIILHILAALCVWYLAGVLFGEALIALVTAVVFLVHPVNVAAVSYISGRADSLALSFMLITFIFYIKSLKREEPFIYAAMLVSYAIALLSKELSLILPALILVYHYSFKKKIEVRKFLPVVITAIGYIIFRSTALKQTLASGLRETQGTLFERLPGAFAALFNYARLIILPFDLHMEYGTPFFAPSDWRVWSGIIIFICLVFYAIRKRKRVLVSFSLAWFIVGILPVSNIYPLNAYMAEHWLYLPAIGIFLLAAGGVSHLHKDKRFRAIAIALPVLLTLFYSALTIKQNAYWKSPIPFYKRTLKYAPSSIRALNDLGRLYEAKGMVKDAEELYRKAIETSPRFPLPYNNLGLIYHNKGDDAKAIPLYETAIELDPNYADALNNLAVVYEGMKKPDNAIALYRRAIGANPNFAGAYNNLGNACWSSGKVDEAIAAYKRSIDIDPRFPSPHYNLVLLYYDAKRYDLAIIHLDRAKALGFEGNPALAKELSKYRR